MNRFRQEERLGNDAAAPIKKPLVGDALARGTRIECDDAAVRLEEEVAGGGGGKVYGGGLGIGLTERAGSLFYCGRERLGNRSRFWNGEGLGNRQSRA